MKIHMTLRCFSLNTDMKYKIRKLDGRYSYREFFKYTIVFNRGMNHHNRGVEWFNTTKLWFEQSYGTSAEIRDWKTVRDWYHRMAPVNALFQDQQYTVPEFVNYAWSWTNGYDDLRIYVRGEQELAFFKLANSVDLKS